MNENPHARAGGAYVVVKRTMDIMVSAAALLLLSPVLLALAVVVRLRLGSPVLFSQLRPGLHGKPFRMFKFRGMTDARDAHGRLLPDADRLTRWGDSCVPRAWMNCPSSGTCWLAT